MDKINNIGLSRMLTNAYDFDGFTDNEVWARIAQKINIVIEHFNYIDKKIDNEKENNKAKFDYLLGEGLTEQVTKALLEKINDGTIGDLINETLLSDVNNKVSQLDSKLNSDINTLKNEVNDKISSEINSINSSMNNTVNTLKTEVNQTIELFKSEVNTNFDDYKEENSNIFDVFKDTVNNELKKYECFIICTNTSQLEKALIKVDTTPSIIYLVNGTYILTQSLYIPSNTKLVGLGKVTIEGDGLNLYFSNKAIQGALGYNGTKNIHIENITFNGKGKTDGLTMIGFAHAENIVIKNCVFKDLHMWHMIELNAVRHGTIVNCKFSNYGNVGANGTEAIQLDSMLSESQFPWFGSYDDTPCKFITIENNIFEDIGQKAIGNHSFKTGVVVQDILIKNNLFNRVSTCIQLSDFDNLTITENKAYDMHGFFMSGNVNNDCNTLTITKNVVQGFFINTIDGLGDERFVGINTTGKVGSFNFYHVTITENDISLLPGHGIGLIADYVTITNNNFYRIYRHGIYHFGGQCANISNNNFRDTGMGTDTNRYAILVNGGGAKSNRVVVSNNTVANLRGICVDVGSNGVEKILVSNNVATITNNAGSNCTTVNNI